MEARINPKARLNAALDNESFNHCLDQLHALDKVLAEKEVRENLSQEEMEAMRNKYQELNKQFALELRQISQTLYLAVQITDLHVKDEANVQPSENLNNIKHANNKIEDIFARELETATNPIQQLIVIERWTNLLQYCLEIADFTFIPTILSLISSAQIVCEKMELKKYYSRTTSHVLGIANSIFNNPPISVAIMSNRQDSIIPHLGHYNTICRMGAEVTDSTKLYAADTEPKFYEKWLKTFSTVSQHQACKELNQQYETLNREDNEARSILSKIECQIAPLSADDVKYTSLIAEFKLAQDKVRGIRKAKSAVLESFKSIIQEVLTRVSPDVASDYQNQYESQMAPMDRRIKQLNADLSEIILETLSYQKALGSPSKAMNAFQKELLQANDAGREQKFKIVYKQPPSLELEKFSKTHLDIINPEVLEIFLSTDKAQRLLKIRNEYLEKLQHHGKSTEDKDVQKFINDVTNKLKARGTLVSMVDFLKTSLMHAEKNLHDAKLNKLLKKSISIYENLVITFVPVKSMPKVNPGLMGTLRKAGSRLLFGTDRTPTPAAAAKPTASAQTPAPAAVSGASILRSTSSMTLFADKNDSVTRDREAKPLEKINSAELSGKIRAHRHKHKDRQRKHSPVDKRHSPKNSRESKGSPPSNPNHVGSPRRGP